MSKIFVVCKLASKMLMQVVGAINISNIFHCFFSERKIIMGTIMFSMLILEDLLRHHETKFQTISLMIYIPIELLNSEIATNITYIKNDQPFCLCTYHRTYPS